MNIMKKISLVSSCVFALALACLLAGCGGMSPTQTADTFLKAIQSGETSAAAGIYDGDMNIGAIVDETDNLKSNSDSSGSGIDEETSAALLEKLRGFQFKLGDEKVDGDTATVDVTITTYNIGNALNNFITKYIQQAFVLALSGADQSKINELASQMFANEIDSAPMDYEKTVPLTMTKVDGKWVINSMDDQKDFVNALSGGMVSAYESFQNMYGGTSAE